VSKFAIATKQIISKLIDIVNKIATRFQTIEDSCQAIFNNNSNVEVDKIALLRNIVDFALKSS